jgi:hypothetical protein
MPTLARLHSCKLTMYVNDHNPPHFHVLANDGSNALVALATLTVIAGSVNAATLKEAQAWAGNHATVLAAKWKALNP